MSGLQATSGDDNTFLNVEKGCLFLLIAAHRGFKKSLF